MLLDRYSFFTFYSLVAVYSDIEVQDHLPKHVYFFTINSGVPKVLITSQN
ncbi:hypothetical protein CUN22_07165 [Enterococcus faecalis]|nr:hypothetical protein CUN22_07165 [Enterococcus faecalis]